MSTVEQVEKPATIMTRTRILKILAAVALLAVAVLCSFELQSTAEPALMEWWGLRVIYGLIGSACLLGIVVLFLPTVPKV
jgi:cbb3-type cytochrome oxidase subunit 1